MVGSVPVLVLARHARITWKIMPLLFSFVYPSVACGVFELKDSHVIVRRDRKPE